MSAVNKKFDDCINNHYVHIWLYEYACTDALDVGLLLFLS